MEEIKDTHKKWKHFPCPWIGKINAVKLSILLEALRFTAISSKIPVVFHHNQKKQS
jgi:hypothetical protein